MEKVSINRADFEELQRIIHIGPVRSANILSERIFNGPFKDIYEISNISRLGQKRMEDIIKQGIVDV